MDTTLIIIYDGRLVFVWGCNGYGRLGLGTGLQHDVLLPKIVPSVSPSTATTTQFLLLIGYVVRRTE